MLEVGMLGDGTCRKPVGFRGYCTDMVVKETMFSYIKVRIIVRE
jgi:hypothetical protein